MQQIQIQKENNYTRMNMVTSRNSLMGKNINEKSHGNYKGNLHVTFSAQSPSFHYFIFITVSYPYKMVFLTLDNYLLKESVVIIG